MTQLNAGKELKATAKIGGTHQWMALKEAADFLGVHFTTLRQWADNGAIAVFRTPGGHRRFSLDDLRRFLAERGGQTQIDDSHALMASALGRVRSEMLRLPEGQARWHYPLADEAEAQRRQRGRQLFSLAISYVVKPAQRERLLESGRELGYEYGREAAASQVGLAETGRAVQFFRSQLADAVRNEEMIESANADDLRIERLIDRFLDEVLYAVLDGYERFMEQNRQSP
jgi:excisionase family DNA binding protein